MELRPGSDVGPFAVVRRLGGGGMGVVWLVRHREDGTLHAVKLLRHVDPRLAVRLRAEGRLQAELDHPNIVRVTGIVEVHGQPALVMEYVPGPTLDALLEAVGELVVPEVDALGRGLLRALAAAHARGQVHRDLKPGNVLLHLTGDRLEPRVTDFGLAAACGETEVGTMTRQGAGTRRYMSLEQLTGAPPEPSMDVFALGAVLFELLDGVPAFPTLHGWRDALRTGRYPEPARDGVPDRIRDAIRAALADRSVRDVDAAALLRRWEADTPEPDAPFRPETLALVAVASARAELVDGDPVHLTWGSTDPSAAHPELPAERDGFVGRAAELAALADRIAAGERLITVHGPGGIGKTRLVLRFARAHPGSVWTCDLSGARDLDGVVRAVALALGVLLDDADPVEQLAHAIARRGRCVGVLDNFEQVVGHAAATLGRWAERAPEAVFVATSRIVLGIPGEQVLRVEPLAETDGIALFVQRAAAANQAFDPSADPEAIRRLVAVLDGLPLAIELCAARVRVMSPSRMLERMPDRFQLLAGGRGRPDRHATLLAALDWSWDLLSPWEQAALAQCSVFAGGFTLDAAEHVLDLSAWPAAPWPIDVLQALVDASLVRELGGRLDLLVSIRDYGARKLGSDGAILRHAAWYADLADRADRSERPALAELDNLAAAARAALSAGQGDLAARAALGAVRVLELRGPIGNGHTLLSEVRDAPGPAPETQARVDVALGRMAQALVRREEARSWFDQALAAFRALGDRPHESATLAAIGNLAWEAGDPAGARAAFDEALALNRALGNRVAEARVTNSLGLVALEAGELDVARALYERALEVFRETGTRLEEGIVVANLAHAHALEGDHSDAIRLYEAALAIHREVGNRKNEARVLVDLGNHHQHFGRLDLAVQYQEAATAVFRELGDRRNEAIILSGFGPIRLLQGRFEEAESALEAALAMNREIRNRRMEAHTLCNLGLLCAETGRRERGEELLYAARAAYHELGSRRAEGVVLARIAEFHAGDGAVTEARAALVEADQLLRGVGDPNQLGILACIGARVCAAEGDQDGVGAALDEAERLARTLGPNAENLLEQYLARARPLRAS